MRRAPGPGGAVGERAEHGERAVGAGGPKTKGGSRKYVRVCVCVPPAYIAFIPPPQRPQENATTLVGDCMLAAGFVSYLGAFDQVGQSFIALDSINQPFISPQPCQNHQQETRLQLWKEVWAPDLLARGIPTTPGCDPLGMLTSDGQTAQMVREGLPGKKSWRL